MSCIVVYDLSYASYLIPFATCPLVLTERNRPGPTGAREKGPLMRLKRSIYCGTSHCDAEQATSFRCPNLSANILISIRLPAPIPASTSTMASVTEEPPSVDLITLTRCAVSQRTRISL